MAKRLTGLSAPALGLDGTPLRNAPSEPEGIGEVILIKSVLANAVARGQSADPVRAMEVARKVYSADSQVVLDDQDIELLRCSLRGDRVLNDMAKAAGLIVLDGAEDIDKPLDPPS